jgi:hypothetical protein
MFQKFGVRYETPRLVWLRDEAVIVSRAFATDPEDTFEVAFWIWAEFDKVAQAVEDQILLIESRFHRGCSARRFWRPARSLAGIAY